ncbi:hypothetical protein TGAMA5MH_01734 [Trichoderma gamsii]|uniref:Peptide hydrolase n=1 Tax=Trichoderma gamsii TaxID=398673 RepID=A0A2K0TMM1_9HYPO|nr:hypothetical protein TGAMA5MH_01734 [Trichoderma gamsii]
MLMALRVIAGEPTRYLIELRPGIQRWVTEEEKWKLGLSGQRFMDITDAQDTDSTIVQIQSPWDGDFPVTFPSKCLMQDKVRQLAGRLSKDAMRLNLHKLNEFYNRYYMSEYGRLSSRWVLERVEDLVKEAGADGTVAVMAFTHPWPQISTIARIQGRTDNTIIIGAHQDSITPYELTRQNVSAIGPEDGSGAVTIMEVFSTLLNDKDVVRGLAQNTVEFHWYGGESAGLLGSQEIFRSYVENGRRVKGMIQQDMVGYIQGTLNASKPETLGVVTDYTHFGLNTFIRTVIDEYCDIPWVMLQCNFACSGHHSAAQAGYPSALVTDLSDSAFDRKYEHANTRDYIKLISYDHMLQHAKLTLGLVYELAHFKFPNVTS